MLPSGDDIVDEALYSTLVEEGLKADDAKHFMYAVHNHYDRFVTWDRNFLNRRGTLGSCCGTIQIQTPEELVSELLHASD